MSSLLENTEQRRNPLIYLAVGAFAVAFFAIIAFGGEKIVLLLNALCFGVIFFIIAYKYHWLMVIFWALSTQMMVEMIIWDYSNYVEPSLSVGGGVDMLYGDPILFVMVAAMIIKLFSGDYRARMTFYRENWLWTAFMIWMLFELARSIMMFGVVGPIGEFRTYFREILIIPYIIIFARTRQDQWRLFLILMGLSLFFIAVGLFRGVYVHNLVFAAYAKWLYQHGSLALLWGALALFLMRHYGFWQQKNLIFFGLIGISMALTVIASHRSVWLAAMVSIAVLFFMGHIRIGQLITMGLIMVVAALGIDAATDRIDLIAFIQERLVALTNPTEDTTANWRYILWLDAIEQSKAHFLEGKGLGNYFQFRAPNGAIVTTMLHNQYIQLLYQIGAIGLILYLAFFFQCLSRLRRTYNETMDLMYKMITTLTITVLLGAAAYYIAYDFEPFTWMFVGLGLSVVQSHAEDRDAAHAYFRAVNEMNRM